MTIWKQLKSSSIYELLNFISIKYTHLSIWEPDITCGISKDAFEIPDKVICPYIHKCRILGIEEIVFFKRSPWGVSRTIQSLRLGSSLPIINRVVELIRLHVAHYTNHRGFLIAKLSWECLLKLKQPGKVWVSVRFFFLNWNAEMLFTTHCKWATWHNSTGREILAQTSIEPWTPDSMTPYACAIMLCHKKCALK